MSRDEDSIWGGSGGRRPTYTYVYGPRPANPYCPWPSCRSFSFCLNTFLCLSRKGFTFLQWPEKCLKTFPTFSVQCRRIPMLTVHRSFPAHFVQMYISHMEFVIVSTLPLFISTAVLPLVLQLAAVPTAKLLWEWIVPRGLEGAMWKQLQNAYKNN